MEMSVFKPDEEAEIEKKQFQKQIDIRQFDRRVLMIQNHIWGLLQHGPCYDMSTKSTESGERKTGIVWKYF